MSILIHMETPKDGECIVIQSDGTAYKYNPGDVVMYGDAYNETADVIELPPHGRLGDLDALGKVMCEGIAPSVNDGGFKHAFDIIRAVANAPTIIPAEGGAGNG